MTPLLDENLAGNPKEFAGGLQVDIRSDVYDLGLAKECQFMISASKSSTPSHIVERNRRNAQKSTGPKTARGREIVRHNAVKHGLRANPASGVVEDPDQFNGLLDELAEVIQPQNVIEENCIHRIAVCIWRLQRAAKIDSGITTLSMVSVADKQAEVQEWIERINGYWRMTTRKETREEVKARRRKDWGSPEKPQNVIERYAVHLLDYTYESEISQSSAGLLAMSVMIKDLGNRLAQSPECFGDDEAEKLSWLIHGDCSRFPKDYREAMKTPLHLRPNALKLDGQIAKAWARPDGAEMSDELIAKISNRMTTLRQLRNHCGESCAFEREDALKNASMLPDEVTLKRLMAYETHAERSLKRSIETLAQLRGATIQRINSLITCQRGSSTTTEAFGESHQIAI